MKKIIIGALALTLVGGFAVNALTDQKNDKFVYSPESNLMMFSSEAMFKHIHEDLNELVDESSVIAKVKVVESKTVANYEEGSVNTYSKLEVQKVYKGSVQPGDILSIAEAGGGYDEREHIKANPNPPGTVLPREPQVVLRGPEKSVPVQAKNEYIVFLYERPQDTLERMNQALGGDIEKGYNITGAIQGKIKVKGNQLVSQVSQESIEHGKTHNSKLFFLPEKYAGHPVNELEQKILESKQ